MKRDLDRPDRSDTDPTETFLTSAGGVVWTDAERTPVLGAELERARDHLIEQDADFPPDDADRGQGDVGPLLREFDRERRTSDG
jgi:hypothetical protein